MALFVLTQATTIYSLPGTNHGLIQGEPYNDSFSQRKYVNISIRNLLIVLVALTTLSIQLPLTIPTLMQTYDVPNSASYLTPTTTHKSSILGTIVSY